jgi:WD40 repeat protein
MLAMPVKTQILFVGLIILASGSRLNGAITDPPRQPVLQTGPSDDSAQPVSHQAESPAPPKTMRTDLYGDPLPEGAIARLGTVRFRHGAYVLSLAFTADGKQLLSYGNNGVRVWEVATVKELRSLLETGMSSVALSADGKFLLTCENPLNRPVVRFRRWSDLKNIEREYPIEAFNATRFSPDGKVLAVATQTCEMQLWDVAGGRKLQSWKAYDRTVPWFTFSDDSKTLITGGSDKIIRLWDVESGKKKHEIVTPSIVGKAFVSRDGALVVSSGMIEEKTGPTSSYSYPEKMIRVWDIATGKELHQLVNPAKKAVGPDAGLALLTLAADGKTVITFGGDAVLSLWDPGTGQEKRRVDIGKEWPTTVTFTPDGKTLALGANAIHFIDLATGKELTRRNRQQSLVSYAGFVLDGRTALTTFCNQTFHLWNPLTGQELGSFTGVEEWAGNETSVDKGRFLIATGPNETIRIYDLAAKKEARRFKIPPARAYIRALSPDGELMAFAAEGKGVILVNLKSGKESRLLEDDEVKVTGVGFGAEGRTLIVWFSDHTIQIWDLATKKNLSRFALGYGSAIRPSWAAAERRDVIWPYTAFVSPDSRYFAYIQHRSFILHELPSLRLVRRSAEFPCDISLVSFSPDDRIIAWASHDSIIHLLETATCKERHQFTGHHGLIYSLAFSSDSRKLISGSEDTTALVWDLYGKFGSKEKWDGAIPAAELDSCWSDLGGSDAGKAYQAIRRLAASSADAAPYLAKRLQPVKLVAPKHPAKLVADLDSNEFAVREAAEKELGNLGELAAPACRKAMANQPSAEVRRRLKKLLEKQALEETNFPPDILRGIRAVETLEAIGTKEAREKLAGLAHGTPEARLTQEAKASLERLAKRSAVSP